ncbi:alkaline phosphatase family protein [Microbacterium murale]|uniref:AlkP superfamily pyrophosphatase or phosphodiesterase n=1 Tax=Microbacterium murale TaxID=1081040 RepID=A0ABU0PE17_9MICO|nr:alkaline phosphatase family protein [Microbacterium murale]MDQ0645571.1 putative AlkP superfamily pyrophosphatase or phosphodiesterase [Microbacterium murale]
MANDLLAALNGADGPLRPARSVVLVIVDGLGAIQLRGHAGHARHLTAGLGKKDVAYSVFPTTTAAALTSTLTGLAPGEHGLVGYQVLDRSRDRLVNQLSGWECDGIDPLIWQPTPTVFERAAAVGHGSYAVGVAAYATSGFTKATLRGAEFIAAKTPAERVAVAYQRAADSPGSLVYCYLPEVDKAGHKHGVASTEWIAALEEIDAALSINPPRQVGVLVTADHGMIDVPAHRHVVLDEGDPRFEGVRHFGGEPRMLHVYLEADADAQGIVATWRIASEGDADVLSRSEAVSAGLFGAEVTPDALSRIGDLLVIARGNRAFYDGTADDQRARGMIGQHGALTPEERQVPYIRRGAFAV